MQINESYLWLNHPWSVSATEFRFDLWRFRNESERLKELRFTFMDIQISLTVISLNFTVIFVEPATRSYFKIQPRKEIKTGRTCRNEGDCEQNWWRRNCHQKQIHSVLVTYSGDYQKEKVNVFCQIRTHNVKTVTCICHQPHLAN